MASGGESDGYDGLFDMKDDTQFVTLSYSTLSNSGRGGLIGSSETDTGNSFITFHHNLYSNIDSRVPLLRGGVAHIYNNSYGNVRDGDAGTHWSPNGATGNVSVKWSTATTVSRVTVVPGPAGTIGTWQLINGDTGAILRSGTGPGTITFPATPLKKITFNITGSTGTPSVAELETYAS
ncbi:pectate lyase [Catenuloplanes nepalensis]|uniref:Pectate lyase n=1 Tax=Catenuloplanes nepalensis TaxID=587533 RepID=A0ABT9MSK2_9ACTN|nr:pectate lyase [Catenuloplanes nepalensis]